jgi:hypothetical protein
MFSAHDKIVTRLVWRGTRTGSYEAVKATGKPAEVRDFAVWRFEDGEVAEISTLQDQFALLKQIGYFPEGSMRRSPGSLAAGGGARQVVRILRRRVQARYGSRTSCRHVDSAGRVAAPMDPCRGINEPLSFSSRLGES